MGALSGLRVIDLSPNRVGAQISQLFADFGAEVIWVEPPSGSKLREQAAFPFWARGKQSTVLDLHDAADRDRLRQLSADADVFIDTFRVGVLDRLGLGYEALAALNPRLVYTSVTGFGSVGPYVQVQGYEGLVAAKLGVFQAFHRMAPTTHPPFVTVPWCSFSASQVALHGTLAALLERETSGLGQRVETSLAQAFSSLDTWAWFDHLIETKWPDAFKRTATFDADGVPTSPFTFFLLVALTKDGHWLQFAQVAPKLFTALIKALGLASVFTDPEWIGLPLLPDTERRLRFWELMLDAANQKTLAEWQEIFEADPDVFAEVIRRGAAVLEHPQLAHDAMVISLDDVERGPVTQPGPLVHLLSTPANVDRPAPRLNAHTPAWGKTTASLIKVHEDTSSAAPSLALEAITILELSLLFAAPHGSTLLTDLGARVIKVEPLAGDPIRTIISFPESGGAKVMQGKESICVDISKPEGLAIVHDLARRSDVVLQGYRAGVAHRIGLDADTLRNLNPDLVYLNAPGYGVGPPDGHRPAYAPSIGAAVGIGRTNVGDTVPERAGLTIEQIRDGAIRLSSATSITNAQADGFAALGVGTAILLGLLARARGAGGQELITTMLNTGAHAMSAQAVRSGGGPTEPVPDAEMRGLSALYRTYDANDGWVFLAAPAEHQWPKLVTALAGELDLAADSRFATAPDRSSHDGALGDVLADVFARRSKADWERRMLSADVGCVAVTTDSVESVYWSQEFGRASGYLADVHHPTFEDHPRMAPLVRFSRSATQAKPGVLAGSHTDAILAELGFGPAAIMDLRERKIVG